MQKLTTLSSLLLLFTLISLCQSLCPPGYFTQPGEQCEICPIGFFCPGDGGMHPCYAGYANSQKGQSSCTSCPSKRSNKERTVCVLPDTPQDSVEIFYENPTLAFTIPQKGGYFFITIPGTYLKCNNTMQLTFVTSKGDSYGSGLIVYASKETGMPTSTSFSFKSIGTNATFFDPKKGCNDVVIYYLNIFNHGTPETEYIAKIFPYYTTTYRFSSDKVHVGHTDFSFFENQVIFVKDSIPVGTRVLVKFRLLSDSIDTYQLLYSSESTESYPNPNNADVVVRGKKTDIALMSVNTATSGGPFVFSLYIPRIALGVAIDFELIY